MTPSALDRILVVTVAVWLESSYSFLKGQFLPDTS